VDLEVLYAQEGVQIGGACEMRSSWKFNELKPRFYYAQGGRDYFAARYIKKLAVRLMESIHSTRVNVRRNPDYFVECDPDDTIAIWDLSAFTSTLHELRFFLYWIARSIEDRGDIRIELLDYRDGIVWANASEMLDNYNETVNINSPFSIHRIIDKYALHEDFEESDFEQQNSGMLGVAGNIGFSTALHGYAIDQTAEPGKSCSVGDDALSARWDDPFETLFPHIQTIGHLHPEKTSLILPRQPGPAKFLKRRLERTETGFFIDFLLKLPLPCLIDERYGGRTPPDMDDYARVKKIATTIGQLVWDVTTHWEELVDHDIFMLSRFLSPIYHSFHLDRRGGLPGSSFRVNGTRYVARFAYPPIDWEFFHPEGQDWLEFLLDQPLSSPMLIPKFTCHFLPELPTEIGETFFGSQSANWGVLEDLGIISCEGVEFERITHVSETNKRRMMDLVRNEKSEYTTLYKYRLLKDVPDHFHFMYAPISRVYFQSIVHGF
jgi:hypothetical protein